MRLSTRFVFGFVLKNVLALLKRIDLIETAKVLFEAVQLLQAYRENRAARMARR